MCAYSLWGLEHHVVYLPCGLFVQGYPSWNVSKFSIVGKIFIICGFFVVCFAELIVVPSYRVISSLEGKFGTVSEIFVLVLERLFMKISNWCKNHLLMV
jgi:hypothetical protein